jgi:hypothetical protein
MHLWAMWPHPKTLHKASAAAHTAYNQACVRAEQPCCCCRCPVSPDHTVHNRTADCRLPYALSTTPAARHPQITGEQLVLLPAWQLGGTGRQGVGHRGHNTQRSCPSYQAVKRGANQLSRLTPARPAPLGPVGRINPAACPSCSLPAAAHHISAAGPAADAGDAACWVPMFRKGRSQELWQAHSRQQQQVW